MKTEIKVAGMSCKHCVKAVTEAAEGVSGVKKAKVDLKAGTAALVYEGEGVIEAVIAAVADAGYEAELIA